MGVDAGQLLAGRAESGELDLDEFPQLPEDIVAAYLSGLSDEGSDVASAGARFGILGNLVVRSAFTALPVELLDSPAPGLRDLFARRALRPFPGRRRAQLVPRR